MPRMNFTMLSSVNGRAAGAGEKGSPAEQVVLGGNYPRTERPRPGCGSYYAVLDHGVRVLPGEDEHRQVDQIDRADVTASERVPHENPLRLEESPYTLILL